ncbi:TIGR00296 family protein, partial [Candidatus Woesearchaeota archaeon]
SIKEEFLPEEAEKETKQILAELSQCGDCWKKRGAFVTLKKKGRLRGCIGFVQPVYPLVDAVRAAAKAAAFEDPRFPPLREEELHETTIELSVLTEPERVLCEGDREEILNSIKIGRDGLIVRMGPYSGLLLPQVATEYHMTEREFLEATCEKAGLPRDAWKDEECEVLKFQAEVFEEKNEERK